MNGLAQYACDHCKQRKLRCSRETPKCGNCRGWSGRCVYSRHGRIRRKPRSHVPARVEAIDTPNSPSSTTSKNFETVAKDLNPFEQLTPFPQWRSIDTNGDVSPPEQSSETPSKDDNGQPFYLGPSPTASFLSQANKNIDQMNLNFSDQVYKHSAENSLSELSNTFAAIHFDDSTNVLTNIRTFRRSNEAFFIPKKEEGFEMIKIFINGMARGRPFYTVPSPDILPKLAFEPSKVQERGWLLIFNAFLSTAISLMKPLDMRLNRGLQWNTWMLLEDSSIFLEPNEVNIRALILVACHGQEISTPSLCWTLISQACQMAQTLALHLPTPAAPISSEAYSQKNCLFWSLFILDKSLSLSFGRPPLLPGYLYKDVPPPDPDQLANYRPHQDPDLVSPANKQRAANDGFGKFFITQARLLAGLQGEIQDTFYRIGRSNNPNTPGLKSSLDKWIEDIRQASPFYEECITDSEERKEVQLGINFLTFQYYHLKIYLTRADKEYQQECLEAARSGVSLLDILVASSAQVFNGIVWQLLYQPFMVYFVIFAKIISDPNAAECFADLQLLRKVVLYFLQMHNNHQSAERLERVAETFTRLAEAYVRHTMQCRNHKSADFGDYGAANRQAQAHAVVDSIDSEYATINPESPNLCTGIPMHTSILEASPNDQIIFNFDGLDSDPVTLLNFFSTSGSEFDSMSSFMENTDGDASTLIDQAGMHPETNFSGTAEYQENPLIRGLENIAQNHSLDGSFDWFSWEQYDSGMN